ncbi:MAG: tyrosine-type recombinase/integrase [Firmicutes bacterium]|nr:tyrosine-type recombinase/integrase [Bacillota bacterium]
MASLKAFFHYLEMEEIVTVSPFRKVKYNAREARRLPKSLSIFEVEKLIAYIYSSTSQDIGVKDKVKTSLTKVRDIAVFELMFATGLRVSELCKLTIKDVDLETQNVRILGKGNKERLIHISNAYVLMSLREYVLKRPNTDSDALFINRTGQNLSEQSVRFFIKRIGKKVLNKLVTPHMIRHSFATLMLEEGVDIRYIQTFLGHSSITTTQIYTHSTTVKQKQIMLNFHPRNRIIVKD